MWDLNFFKFQSLCTNQQVLYCKKSCNCVVAARLGVLLRDRCPGIPYREESCREANSNMNSYPALQLLSNRLDFLDITILGNPNEDAAKLSQLKGRLDAVIETSQKIENEVPQLSVCRGLLSKLKPYLSRSKSSLAQTVEQIDAVLAIKGELEDIVKMLMMIETTSLSANLSVTIDIALYQKEISRVEIILLPLLELSKRQSEEIDDFLSTYENAVWSPMS